MAVGAQAAVGVTFAVSTAAKVAGRAAFEDFRRWLSAGAGVPRRAARPLAAAVVAVEAATAAAMLVPPLAPYGLAVAVALSGLFTVAVAGMIRRRTPVPCRCFGAGRRPPGPVHVVRNLILLLIAALGCAMAVVSAGPPPLGQTSVLTAVAGAAAAFLLIDLEELVVLFGRLPSQGQLPR